MYLLPVYRGYGEKIFFNKAHLFYHVFTSSLQGLWRKNFLIKPPTSSSIQPNSPSTAYKCFQHLLYHHH